MASSPNGLKGNPASKRMSNAHRKAYRAALWAKQKKRAAARQAKQDAAHAAKIAK
jgi:uncharacterized membrane protein